MPACYTIDADRGVVFTIYSGHVTNEDMVAHTRALLADSDHRRHYDQLVDTRAVERVEVTAEGVRSLADITPFGPSSRRAVVAERDVIFGLSRIFEMSIAQSGDNFRVVRTFEEAVAFLGLEHGTEALSG